MARNVQCDEEMNEYCYWIVPKKHKGLSGATSVRRVVPLIRTRSGSLRETDLKWKISISERRGHETVICCSLTARLSHGKQNTKIKWRFTSHHSGTRFIPTNVVSGLMYQHCFRDRPYFKFRHGVVMFEDNHIF